jgi:hypothetical protein
MLLLLLPLAASTAACAFEHGRELGCLWCGLRRQAAHARYRLDHRLCAVDLIKHPQLPRAPGLAAWGSEMGGRAVGGR